MGYQKDQTFPGETYRPGVPPPRRSPIPPPLPPRKASEQPPSSSQPPPVYEETPPEYHSQPLTHSWAAQDPRSSSTQSLVPEDSGEHGKRTLLLVFVHGFMGNETSFQSFPAHVHNLVSVTLADTHVVHTKIYPKYKSRKAIEYVRDDFGTWLSPHESLDTDVILLGHSMGGLLSAEVALVSPEVPTDTDPFRHHILGTINFDTPFLGMHPGVVVSGIGSLFRPAPDPAGTKAATTYSKDYESRPMPYIDGQEPASIPATSSLHLVESQSSAQSGRSDSTATSPLATYGSSSLTSIQPVSSSLASPTNDPNYNPPFPNDMGVPTRTGWNNAFHFIMKHSDGLTQATKSYVTSHLEFGGCMADYKGLQSRYSRIRALEDVDQLRKDRSRSSQPTRRIRFANYYTASTGRPSKEKLEKSDLPYGHEGQSSKLLITDESIGQELQDINVSSPSNQSPPKSPQIFVEEYKEWGVVSKDPQNPDEPHPETGHDFTSDDGAISDVSQGMNHMDPSPISDDEDQGVVEDRNAGKDEASLETVSTSTSTLATVPSTPSVISPTLQKSPSLPPIPPEPTEPSPFEPSKYPDKDTRKLAEKDYSRLLKAYQRAIKDRDGAIKDRRKLLEKREKNARLAREKQIKLDEKERVKAEKEEVKRLHSLESSRTSSNPKAESVESSTTNIKDVSAPPKDLKAEKPKRDKKFCMLPPKVNGRLDQCWVRVYMVGVDEVGAHCGLFFVGEHYEGLVADVGARIEEWVKEDGRVRGG